MWDLAEGLPRRPLPLPQRWKREGFRVGMRRAMTAAAVVTALAIGAAFWFLEEAGISTAVGEQRMLILSDSTRIYLNTDTQIVERYSRRQRTVELRRGEAWFEVAPRSGWPFVVTADDTQIRALGTAFVVRREQGRLSVTLMEGSVSLGSARGEDAVAAASLLNPGERITYEARRTPRVDRPELQAVTAWRRGRVELNDAPLREAVAEINRYSDLKIRVEQPESDAIIVRGAFRAGDTVSFAHSVATTCGLLVVQREHELLLAGAPSPHCSE
jgi:transmembrane sensor